MRRELRTSLRAHARPSASDAATMEHALLSLLALASLPFQAPQVPEQEPAPVVQTDERAKELNRVIYFAGGGCIRSKARWVDDHWEYRSGGQWTPLAEPMVARVVLERELLREAHARAAKLAKGDDAGHARHGEWLLSNGLLEEGLSELDRVFEHDPDQQDALEIMRKPSFPLRVPGADCADIVEAVRLGSLTPRALQETVIASLEQRADREALIEALKRGLTSTSGRLRCLSARALRRLAPQAELRGLISRAVLDGSDEVRFEAALALRDAQVESVVLPVIRTLGSESPAIRRNAIEALGTMGYPAAIEPLFARLAALSAPQGGSGWSAPRSNIFVGRQFAYVQDFDVEVAQFAAVADPQVNVGIEGSVLDVRVISTYQATVAIESRHVRGALGRLSGASPGNSNRSWLDWWEQHKGEYGVTSTPSTPSAPTTPPPMRGR